MGYAEVWLAMPLEAVIKGLIDRSEDLWVESKKAGGVTAEYERVESLLKSLERVLVGLGATVPPRGSQECSEEVSVPHAGPARARGRVCFACRRQIRRTSDMVVVSPVRLPGLTVHESCFLEMEEEFGGRQ